MNDDEQHCDNIFRVVFAESFLKKERITDWDFFEAAKNYDSN